MQDPTIDYSLQRLSKMIPKHADDPDRLSKVRLSKTICLKFSMIKFRKWYLNVQLIYLNNVTLCQAIHIILLYQHHQAIMKMIQVCFWVFLPEQIFIRYFYSLLNLFSAYYMSSLEGIREWMHSNYGKYAIACHVIFFIFFLF